MTTTAPAPRATATAPVEERKLNLGRAAAWVFMGLMIFASLFIAGAKLAPVVYAIPALPVITIALALLPATARWARP